MGDEFDDPGTGAGSELPGGFRAAVVRELEANGYEVGRWHADGLDYTTPDGDTGYLGLGNLFRRVKTADPADRDAVIRDFLGHVLRSGADRPDVPDDLEAVPNRVLVRLGRPFADGLERPPWSKPLPGTDLALNLVIDFPDFMTYVTPDLLAQSDRPPGDWLDQAVENLKDRTPVDWLEVLHEESGIRVGNLNDSYDAARALILTDVVEDGPEAGWLVAVPARDWLFCRPARVDGVPHFHLLKVLAEKNYERQPYPISDQVFWVRGHKWTPFPIELDADAVRLTPPDGFLEAIGAVEAIEGLPDADDDDRPSEPGLPDDGTRLA